MLHEFGHSLACRQVGGKAERIVLWPLGGVAYVSPPQRPGATLWSIAAGPLVNVVLAPILTALCVVGARLGWADSMPNLLELLYTLQIINFRVLIFNLLPFTRWTAVRFCAHCSGISLGEPGASLSLQSSALSARSAWWPGRYLPQFLDRLDGGLYVDELLEWIETCRDPRTDLAVTASCGIRMSCVRRTAPTRTCLEMQ
jgi:fumarate reductase subunit D